MVGFERFFKLLKLTFGWGPRWIKQVEKDGREAKAEVLANPADLFKGLGGYEGEDKWIEFRGRVEPADGAPYEAEIKCRLSHAFGGHMTPGLRVNVKYDPSDRSRVVLVDDVVTLIKYRVKK